MQLFSTQHCFNHSWSQVTRANWQKYPNSMSTQVVHVDTLSRSIDSKTGVLRTERLITVKQPIPKWLERIFNTDSTSYFLETSEVDPIRRTHTATSVNLTFSNILSLEEKVTYREDPSDKQKRTLMQQEATAEVIGSFAGFRSALEDFCLKRFQLNAEKGRKGMEEVLRNLMTDQALA